MSEAPKLVETVARAIYEGRNGAGCMPWSRRDAGHKAPYRGDARAALNAIRNHTFGETVILANGTDLVAKLPGDVPQTVLRALIDLAMAEGAALASPEEGRTR